MAGQGIERREALAILSIAAMASRFPGFVQWGYVCQHQGETSQIRPARYRPLFFEPEEYVTIERLVEVIIPADGGPGAREAGVAEFIDFMVAHDAEVQYPFRTGIAWLNAQARQMHGAEFVSLVPADQSEILDHLAFRDRFRPGEEDGRAFFQLARRYTVMGFYTTRAGLEQLDCPQLKNFSESPGCPHPEHQTEA